MQAMNLRADGISQRSMANFASGHKLSASLPIAKRQKIGVSGATSQTASPSTEKLKPDWAGDGFLSQLANAAINFKPLYNVMKVMAKNTVIQTVEKKGLPWRKRVEELSNNQEIYKIREEIEDKTLQYPEYYIQAFHAYDQGNLDWTAAFEAELATLAMASRTFKDEEISMKEAQDKLRGNIHEILQAYREEHGMPQPSKILDMGCSVGVSTRYIANEFPEAQVTGLDLSPHFLAVAEFQEREEEKSQAYKRQRINYHHALAEDNDLPEGGFDIVQVGFTIHECPPFAIENISKEALRLLKPGGCLLVFDNNPRSKTIQNLPPALAILMKSTEPWSDFYYQMDVEESLRKIGYENVGTKECDHRHRCILGLKPLK